VKIPQSVNQIKTTLQGAAQRAQSMSGIVMNGLKQAALAEVPHYNRSGFYSQVVLVLACAFYFQWYPVVPTAAISVLGVVAAFMTIRALKPDSFSRGEQIVYIGIAFALLAIEMNAVYREQDRHNKEQADQRAMEDKTRKEEHHAFEVLIQSENKLVAKQEEMFGEITGAGSYLYMMPTAPISSGGKTFEVTLLPQLIGVHPIHAVIVSVFGPRGSYTPINYGDVFSHELERPREGKNIKFDDDYNQPISFAVPISGSNGSFFEELQFRKVGATWKRMFAVIKQGKPEKIVCSWMETGLSISAPSKEEKRLWPTATTIRTDGNNMGLSCK
jgi:hypothetical protein